MVKEKIVLAGLNIENNKKWYCNKVDGSDVKCCDTYDEKGNHIQRIGRYIITGEEEWRYNPTSKCYYFYANNKYFDEIDGGRFDPMLCTHFRWTSDIEHTPLYMFSGGRKNEIQFNYDNGIGGVDNFVCWIKEQLKKEIQFEVYYILLYPYYYEPSMHRRTAMQVMKGLQDSLRTSEKNSIFSE